jgi:hypothetical protein
MGKEGKDREGERGNLERDNGGEFCLRLHFGLLVYS